MIWMGNISHKVMCLNNWPLAGSTILGCCGILFLKDISKESVLSGSEESYQVCEDPRVLHKTWIYIPGKLQHFTRLVSNCALSKWGWNDFCERKIILKPLSQRT